MTLLAAFEVLLLRYTGQEDVLVGTPIAGRERGRDRGPDRVLRQHARAPRRPVRRPDLPRAPRARPRGRPWRLRPPGPSVREAGRRAPARARSRVTRRSSRSCSCSRTRRRRPADAARPGRPAPLELDLGAAKFDLTLRAVGRRTTGCAWSSTYNTDLFDRRDDRAAARALARPCSRASQRIPAAPIARLPLMSAAESAQLARVEPGPRAIPTNGAACTSSSRRQAARAADRCRRGLRAIDG